MQAPATETQQALQTHEIEVTEKQPKAMPHFPGQAPLESDTDAGVMVHALDKQQAVPKAAIKQAKSANKDQPEDLQKEIQKHKSNCKVYIHIVVLCLGAFFVGYELAVLNLSQNKLNYVYKITDNKALYQGLLTASLPFGAIFGGGFFSQFLLRNIGERRSMMLIDIIGMLISILFLGSNWYVALFARFVCGIIMGVNEGIVPLYIREMSPLQMNGKTGSFFQTFVAVGILTAYCVGLGFPLDDEELKDQDDWLWRFALTFPIITCGIRLILFKFVYTHTTPHNYILIGKNDRAKVALGDIYKKEFVEEQFVILEHELAVVKKNKDSFWSIFEPFNFPRLKLGCIVMMLFQFTGFNAVTYYSKIMFKAATGSKETAITLVIIQGALKCITSTFAGEIAKCFGRRPVLLCGKFFQATMLLILGIVSIIYKDDVEDENVSDFAAGLTVTLLFLFIMGFSFSTGTVSWFYNSDILTGQMSGVVIGLFQCCGLIIALTFPIGEEALGIYTMFFIYCVCTYLGFFYLYPNLKETKGLSKHQIQQMFAGKTLHAFGSSYIEIRKPKQEQDDSVEHKKEDAKKELNA